MQKVALVLGATGITGWSVLHELLTYPSSDAFESVIGVSRRPIDRKEAMMPVSERLRLVSGVDLARTASEVKEKANTISGLQDVTHVFLFAYIHAPPPGETFVDINKRLMQNMLMIVNELCPKTEHVVFQTGGKTYGHHVLGVAQELGLHLDVPQAPLHERNWRLPDPWLKEHIHYYKQMELLEEAGSRADWAWTQVVPEAIIGFSPTSNDMNMAKALAVFLLMWKALHGAGAEVPFPGSRKGYEITSCLSDMSTVARFLVWAALNGNQTSGETFNITELDKFSWSTRWPIVTSLLGLRGTGPASSSFDLGSWVQEHKAVWSTICQQHGLAEEENLEKLWPFTMAMLALPLDRHFDNSKRLAVGFTDDTNGVDSLKNTWRLLERANQLPPGFFQD